MFISWKSRLEEGFNETAFDGSEKADMPTVYSSAAGTREKDKMRVFPKRR